MRFLPKEFNNPPKIETNDFIVRPITINDVVKDYDAVMSSRDHLWERFGSTWGWPPEDLSIEQDLIDLAWHQKEAQIQSTFNYAVMSPDQAQLLGCIYIDPPSIEGTDAEVWFWARQSELLNGLESKIEDFVLVWLNESWPFTVVSLNNKICRIN